MPVANPEATDVALRPVRAASRRERTEGTLIDAATQVFLDRGYDGATTAQIARVAGVAAGTYYLYFEDKRGAFVAVSRRAARTLLEQIRSALEPGTDGATLVRLTLDLVADFWRSDRALSKLILSGGPALGMDGENAFVDEVCETIEEIGVRKGTEAMALALFLVGLSLQLGHLIVARPDARTEAESLIELAANRL